MLQNNGLIVKSKMTLLNMKKYHQNQLYTGKFTKLISLSLMPFPLKYACIKNTLTNISMYISH